MIYGVRRSLPHADAAGAGQASSCSIRPVWGYRHETKVLLTARPKYRTGGTTTDQETVRSPDGRTQTRGRAAGEQPAEGGQDWRLRAARASWDIDEVGCAASGLTASIGMQAEYDILATSGQPQYQSQCRSQQHRRNHDRQVVAGELGVQEMRRNINSVLSSAVFIALAIAPKINVGALAIRGWVVPPNIPFIS